MRDPEADAREYDPAKYWKNPVGEGKDKGLTVGYWSDPWPELQGMLTSEHIRLYHEAVGRMIRPFDPDRLKPASYELTLANSCLVEGEAVVLTDDEPVLTIPPNSIAYVSMQQVLFMPHYLVGRFDLAIEFIYKGLLLGTGPQIDPGFQGPLSCPLHNISNDPIEIRLGHPFAKLDFAKTAPRRDDVAAALSAIQTEDELIDWLKSEAPEWVRLFKGGSRQWRKPIYGYLEGRRPTSSVRALRDEFGTFSARVRADVNTLRARFDRGVSIGLATLVVTLLIGVPALIFGVVEGRTGELVSQDDLTKLEERTKDLEKSADQQDLAAEVSALKSEVCLLRKQRPPFC